MSNTTNLFAGLSFLDQQIVDLALTTLAELLESPTSADREHLGEVRANAWIARCKQLNDELFLLTSGCTYVIHSASEAEASDGAGYWSNEDGWTNIEGATRFTAAEQRSFHVLPASAGSDAEWTLSGDTALTESPSSKTTEENNVIKTTLVRAINAADTVICNNYEIDGFEFTPPGYVRLQCGEDVIAVLKDGDIEIDQWGDARLQIHEDEVTEKYANKIDLGGDVLLTFKVCIPVRADDIVEA